MDKRTFLALVFLQHKRLGSDDLVEITTQGGEVIEIAIDAAATALVEHGYLTDDGALSPEGREALAVGRQLYSDDVDVQGVVEQLQLQKVVNG